MLARTPTETKKERLDRALAECLAKAGTFPVLTQPVPIIGTKVYAPEPCSNPRQRLGAAYYNPTCFCGWMMGEHKPAKIIEFQP